MESTHNKAGTDCRVGVDDCFHSQRSDLLASRHNEHVIDSSPVKPQVRLSRMPLVEVLQVVFSFLGKGVKYSLVELHVFIVASRPMLVDTAIQRLEFEAGSWVECEVHPVLRLHEEAALEKVLSCSRYVAYTYNGCRFVRAAMRNRTFASPLAQSAHSP